MRHFHITHNIVFQISPVYYCRTKRKRNKKCSCFFLCEGVGGGRGGHGVIKCILGNVKTVSLTFHFYHKTEVLKFNNVFICKHVHFCRPWSKL